MDRRVRAHENHTVELHLIRRLELLVHRHLLVSNKTIEHSVVSNTRQVTVVLDSYEGVCGKRRKSETVCPASQRLRLECGCVAVEQSLDDVDNRRLTRTALAVEHEELLDPLRVTLEYRSDSPFDLASVLLIIQCRDQPIPALSRTRLQRIWKSLTRIVLAARFVVCKDQFPIQLDMGVGQILNPPTIDRPALRVVGAHQRHVEIARQLALLLGI